MTEHTQRCAAAPLLTIIVPTYNRADSLALLLCTLQTELAGLGNDVAVLVSDNASTDHTPQIIRQFQRDWPALQAQRQASNLGPDGNFCSCVERVVSRYFWFISDDDLPKRGVITQIVCLLRESTPALAYMQSEWLNPITGPDQGEPVGTLQVQTLDALGFARRVHVWSTFISGVIIDRSRLMPALGTQHTIRRFTGTNLVQLGWILPLLHAKDERFAFVNNRCILATKDNTGGYPLLTVFGARFAHIANEVFGPGSPLARVLVAGTIRHYLPGLLWGARTAPSGRHNTEDPWPSMRKELGGYAMFWLLLVPLGRFPRWLAQPFYQAWRVFHRLHREIQRLRTRHAASVSGASR